MTHKFIALPATALLLGLTVGTHAVAGSVTLQGTYLITFTETCQASFSWGDDPSTGDINTINSVDNGKISTTTGTVLFDQSSHKAKVRGFQEIGDLLIIQEHGGQAMSDAAFNVNLPYESDLSFLKLGGVSYHAAYTPATGAVTSAVFGGLTGNNNECAVTGTLNQTIPVTP